MAAYRRYGYAREGERGENRDDGERGCTAILVGSHAITSCIIGGEAAKDLELDLPTHDGIERRVNDDKNAGE